MDYRKILLAYIRHVILEEGCDFVSGYVRSHFVKPLNDEEVDELYRLVEEARDGSS